MTGSVPNIEDDTVYVVPEYGSHIAAMQDMLLTIKGDSKSYDLARDYIKGNHRKPNVPSSARVEVHEIAQRATMNLMPLLIGVPSQLCFIEGFYVDDDDDPPEWQVFKDSKMASKQTVAFKSALSYGNAFLSLENPGEKEGTESDLEMKLLQTSQTVAYYHDPVNDSFPAFAMTIRSQPKLERPGLIVFYDEDAITYYDWYPGNGTNEDEFVVNHRWEHDMKHTPVRRLVCQMDDEGSVVGLVEQMIPMQDRVNQTAFDLLVTQTFSSFKVRWASGMMGDPIYDIDEDGNEHPRLDGDGRQVYKPIPIDQSTWIMTDDPNSKVGTLDETPLDGFLQAFDEAIRHFAVVGQLPPHNLLGNMSNVTAETLTAAMSQTVRFTHVLRTSWGDAISDLLGLVSVQWGHREDLSDYGGEPNWRDMSDNTLSAVVDALGKGAQMLDIPKQELWSRFPGASHTEVMSWKRAADEQPDEDVMNDMDTPQGGLGRDTIPSTDATQMPREPMEPYRGESRVSNV